MNTNQNAKRILIYGDSFVYGKASGANRRLPVNERFSGVLQDLLGGDFEVIEEGLRGRTLAGENGFFEDRNGLVQFAPVVGSHLPVELVIILLGTNDCNSKSSKTPDQIKQSFVSYKSTVNEWSEFLNIPDPQILLVAPPSIDEGKYDDAAAKIFGEGAAKKVAALPEIYKEAATSIGVNYLDSSVVCSPANGDGIHLDTEGNRQLAEALEQKVREIIQ